MNDLFLVLGLTVTNLFFLVMLVVWKKRHDDAARRERAERLRYYVSR